MTRDSIGRELRSLNNVIKRYLENLESFQYAQNITGTNGWIIAYLADHADEEVYQKDLEKQFSVTRSTSSKVIKRMEEKGLILREGVATDARLKKLVLTQKAMAMHNAIVEDLQNVEESLTRGFTPEELKTCFAFLSRLKENVETSLHKTL